MNYPHMVCYGHKKKKILPKPSTTYFQKDYLHLTDGKFPVVKVTPNAVPVLKGEEKIWMKKTVTPVVEIDERAENQDLFENPSYFT